jgi:hypothetical protein
VKEQRLAGRAFMCVYWPHFTKGKEKKKKRKKEKKNTAWRCIIICELWKNVRLLVRKNELYSENFNKFHTIFNAYTNILDKYCEKKCGIINTENFKNDMALQDNVFPFRLFTTFSYWDSAFSFGCKGLTECSPSNGIKLKMRECTWRSGISW